MMSKNDFNIGNFTYDGVVISWILQVMNSKGVKGLIFEISSTENSKMYKPLTLKCKVRSESLYISQLNSSKPYHLKVTNKNKKSRTINLGFFTSRLFNVSPTIQHNTKWTNTKDLMKWSLEREFS